MSEVEETSKRLMAMKGVTGMMIVNQDGIPLKTSFNAVETTQWVGNVHEFAQKCIKCLKSLDSSQELNMVRIRTLKYELMLAPEKDYMIIVIQKPEVQG